MVSPRHAVPASTTALRVASRRGRRACVLGVVLRAPDADLAMGFSSRNGSRVQVLLSESWISLRPVYGGDRDRAGLGHLDAVVSAGLWLAVESGATARWYVLVRGDQVQQLDVGSAVAAPLETPC